MPTFFTEAFLIALVPAVVSIFAAYLTVKIGSRNQDKEREASASAMNVDRALKLNQETEERLTAAEDSLAQFELRCKALESEATKQHLQILNLRNRVRVITSYAHKLVAQLEKIGVSPDVSIEEIEEALRNGNAFK